MTTNAPLDIVRCEALAVAGFAKEATAVSETRVAIDRLARAYWAWEYHDMKTCVELDQAIFNLIPKP